MSVKVTNPIQPTRWSTCRPLVLGEQGWRSGESARFPPMWPGFDSRTRCHMWVEFVVGSRPCSEGFSPGSPVFLPPQKPTLPNSNSIGNSRATGLSVARLLCATLVKHSRFIYFLFLRFGRHTTDTPPTRRPTHYQRVDTRNPK